MTAASDLWPAVIALHGALQALSNELTASDGLPQTWTVDDSEVVARARHVLAETQELVELGDPADRPVPVAVPQVPPHSTGAPGSYERLFGDPEEGVDP